MSQVLNRPRAEAVLAEAGADHLIASTYQNVFYLGGYIGFSQRLSPTTQVYALAAAADLSRVTLVAPISDLDMQAQFPAAVASLVPYGRFFVEPNANGGQLTEEMRRYEAICLDDPGGTAAGQVLLEQVRRLSGRVAVDERGLLPAIRDAVRAELGDRFIGGTELLDRIRMVKTPEEVRRLERAALVIEESYVAALDAAEAGMTETDMARVFDQKTVELGSDPYFTVIAFGERGAFPNAIPSPERRLRRGDLIRFDIGCKTEMYNSDIARTAVFGEPDAKAASYYAAILAGEDRMLEVMRPGVTARQAFEAGVEGTRAAGIPHYRRHHVGHGIGLDTYDQPVLNAATETVLEPGMVFEIETPYYELGFGGIQVEDTIVITEDGWRMLTRTPRALRVVGG